MAGNDGFTIFAAMKFANTSFIHTSLNHRMVTRSPNHMCAVSCEMTLARLSRSFWRGRRIEQQAARVVEDRARMLHAAELKGRHEQEVELAERIGNARVPLHPVDGRGV